MPAQNDSGIPKELQRDLTHEVTTLRDQIDILSEEVEMWRDEFRTVSMQLKALVRNTQNFVDEKKEFERQRDDLRKALLEDNKKPNAQAVVNAARKLIDMPKTAAAIWDEAKKEKAGKHLELVPNEDYNPARSSLLPQIKVPSESTHGDKSTEVYTTGHVDE